MKKYTFSLTLLLSVGCSAFAAEDSMTIWSSPVSATSNILEKDTINNLDKKSVASALSLIPGVTLQKSGSRNELQVRVRGFNSRQVPIFFDGVPIYVPYDGNLDLGRFSTSDISSLEVSKGYSSLLQGPNQMGGAINITTPKPTAPLAGNIGFRQGWVRNRDNVWDAHAALAIRNDLGYLQLNGSRLKQDFLGLPYGSNNRAGQHGKMSNSSTDDKRGIIKLGFTPRINDEYIFTWISQDGAKNDPPYSGTGSQNARYWQWPEYNKQSYYYQGTTHLNGGFTLKSRAYRDEFDNTLFMYNSLKDFQNKRGNYSHYADYTNGAGLQLSADIRESDLLSFAINWKDDVHREKGTFNAPYNRYKDRTWSLASEYQWDALENLAIVTGISYDWRDSLQGMKYEKTGIVRHFDSNSQSAFNWEIMAKYTFASQDTLSFSLSERSRFPTLKERYTTVKPAHNKTSIINPWLKPERADSIDLTYSGTVSQHWGYEASIYYNRISDAILSYDIDASTTQNRNSGRVDYAGFDLGIKGKILDSVDTGLSYGLIHSAPKNNTSGKITDTPIQTLNAWINVTPWKPLTLTISEEARSSTYSNSRGTQKAAGFATTHVRADYDVGYGLSLNASVHNLFDTVYYYSEGFIEEGRNYWAGIEYKF
ncbi:TonB-dependent receptor plug domain-containing protein [[Pantoea] beijingensis]|nr:TonB-dependent receptor [[Pantoea] beijingensis]